MKALLLVVAVNFLIQFANGQSGITTNPLRPKAPSDQLAYCTAQIKTYLPNGKTAYGTGFFFAFRMDSTKEVRVLVTNKHVISFPGTGGICLTKMDAAGLPVDSAHTEVRIPNFYEAWIPHPDPEIDLAVLPLNPFLREYTLRGENFFYVTLDDRVLISDKEYESLETVEDVLMVGYPVAVWDSSNNKPVFRRGITATHPKRHYNGRNEFLVDIACYGGSSGSPVFLYNEGSYNSSGGLVIGTRVKLLGILYAGVIKGPMGAPQQAELPVLDVTTARMEPIINLGVAIRADQLWAFHRLFLALLQSPVK